MNYLIRTNKQLTIMKDNHIIKQCSNAGAVACLRSQNSIDGQDCTVTRRALQSWERDRPAWDAYTLAVLEKWEELRPKDGVEGPAWQPNTNDGNDIPEEVPPHKRAFLSSNGAVTITGQSALECGNEGLSPWWLDIRTLAALPKVQPPTPYELAEREFKERVKTKHWLDTPEVMELWMIAKGV